MEKELLISVTHFINPHLFWFHELHMTNEDICEINRVENELMNIFGKNTTIDHNYRPKVGDLTALSFTAWNRFIRARILDKDESLEEYIVWAVDYGFPIQTKLENIQQLPRSCRQCRQYVHCGGLANVLPAEIEYDFNKGNIVMVRQDKWLQRACDLLEKLLYDAASVSFVEKFQTSDGHHWGSLRIINKKGNTFDAHDYLISVKLAMEAGPRFYEMCSTLNSIKLTHWRTNDGNLNLKMNSRDGMKKNLKKDFLPNNLMSNDVTNRQVVNWLVPNECIDGPGGRVTASESKKSIANTGDFSISSASSQSEEQRQETEVSAEKNYIGKAGVLTAIKLEKYGNQQNIPPAANVHDYKIHPLRNKGIQRPAGEREEELSPVQSLTSYSKGISLRLQELVEMRKKHATFVDNPKNELKDIDVKTVISPTSNRTSCSSRTAQRRIEMREKLIHKEIELSSTGDLKEKKDDLQETSWATATNQSPNATKTEKEKEKDSNSSGSSVENGRAKGRTMQQKLQTRGATQMITNQNLAGPTTTTLAEIENVKQDQRISAQPANDEKFSDVMIKSVCEQISDLPQCSREENNRNKKIAQHDYDSQKNVKCNSDGEQSSLPVQYLKDATSSPSNFGNSESCSNKFELEGKALEPEKNIVPLKGTQYPNAPPADNFSLNEITSAASTISTKIVSKRRQLKSPETQMNKMDQILRRAKLEKQLGNSNILDLNSLNWSCSQTDSSADSFNETLPTFRKNTDTNNEVVNTTMTKTCHQHDFLGNNEKLKEALKDVDVDTRNDPTTARLKHTENLLKVERKQQLRTKFIDNLVLAHSSVPLCPLERMADAIFLPEIHEEMQHFCINKVYPIQAYAWPHLLHGDSLFVVNPSTSGKTWSYLPAICSLVCYRIGLLTATYGPVAIILVASLTHVEQIHNNCCRLMSGLKSEAPSTVPSFGVRNLKKTKIQLLSSCGILVATPSSLLRLFRDNENEPLFDPNRLMHLVMDDIDLMLLRAPKDLEEVLKYISKISIKSKYDTLLPQVVVTSKGWDALLIRLMQRSSQPLLLIGDFLEAAVYGRTTLSVKLRSSQDKAVTVLNFIKQSIAGEKRVLILCNSAKDVDEVTKCLTMSGHKCISFNNRSTINQCSITDDWKTKFSSQILVCTDDAFPELQIQNIHILIHYSLPTSWTKFTKRFSALTQTYENLVSLNFEQITAPLPTAQSMILLDEENGMQLPRLIEFLRKHHQTVPAEIVAVSKRVLAQLEETRIFQSDQLCPQLMEFGECDEQRCDHRHELTRSDVIHDNDNIPTTGDLRIHILKVVSPTHYTARLLQHKSPNSQEWRELRCSNQAMKFGIQLNMYYSNVNNLVQHWPPHINDMCIYKVSDTFQRALVLKTSALSENVNVAQQLLTVTVKLIDVGSVISAVKGSDLFVCDDKFKEFPAQAIDVRLTGVTPCDNERTWDPNTTKLVQKWIMSDLTKRECVHASISFALANTIWVSNVIVMEELPTVGQYIYRLNLKRSLLENNYAVVCKSRRNMCEIAEEYGLLTTFRATGFEPDSQSVQNNDILSDSSTRDKQKEVNDTNRESSETKFPSYNIDDKSAVGGNGKYTDDENWKDSLENEKNLNEVYVAHPSNKVSTGMEIYLPSDNRLESWCKLPLNQLIKVEIGDESENGNWGNIFLQIIDKDHVQRFDQLLGLVNEHIANIKNKNISVERLRFAPMQNCIVKYNNNYLRAKVYGIFGKDEHESVYRFFLCDYGCFINAKRSDLHKDFLYETTDEIVNFMPYQAVHCTLAGIQWNHFAKRYQVTKDYLYACAVVERSAEDIKRSLNNLQINSYQILLYECEIENDFQSAQMLNKMLLDNGIVSHDPNTKYLLEYEIGAEAKHLRNEDASEIQKPLIKNPTERIATFEELLQSIRKSYELDMLELAMVDGVEKNEKSTSVPFNLKSKNNQKISEKSNMKTNSEEIGCNEKVDKGLCSVVSSDSSHQTCSMASNNNDQTFQHSPPLKTLHKRPQTTWYETDCIIYLSIHAPDIDDYYLEVTKDTLYFATIIQGEKRALILNFLGTVEPQYVSHEVRGLNVIVRLLKSIFMKWPRLLQQSTKFSWLHYNFNAFDESDVEHLLSQQRLQSILGTSGDNTQISDSDSQSTDSEDSERNDFQTFQQIDNSDDEQDPFS